MQSGVSRKIFFSDLRNLEFRAVDIEFRAVDIRRPLRASMPAYQVSAMVTTSERAKPWGRIEQHDKVIPAAVVTRLAKKARGAAKHAKAA